MNTFYGLLGCGFLSWVVKLLVGMVGFWNEFSHLKLVFQLEVTLMHLATQVATS